MAREELGLDPDDLGSPRGAAIASMLAFALGAVVPIAPYLFGDGDVSFVLSAALSALALFIVGSGLAWMAGVTAWWGGLRMLLFGGAAAAVTYGVGSAIGVAIKG
jgi:VIT1/CCC1 family predicted Fe2+/Mn2+ transporter